MNTIAYLCVSKDSQGVRKQHLGVLEFTLQVEFDISAIMQFSVPSRRLPKVRQSTSRWRSCNPATSPVSKLSVTGSWVEEGRFRLGNLYRYRLSAYGLMQPRRHLRHAALD